MKATEPCALCISLNHVILPAPAVRASRLNN